MVEDFVSFEIAKKLKEKGFNEYSDMSYTKIGLSNYTETYKESKEFYCYAPTISQVLRWLRNEKKIYCLPHFEQGIDMWLFCIERPQACCDFAEYISESIYNTYEDAALAGIEYICQNKI